MTEAPGLTATALVPTATPTATIDVPATLTVEDLTVTFGALKTGLLVGAGANRKLTSRMLQRFVNKTNIPFFTTQMGKGVLDERQDLYLGTAALSERDVLHQAPEAADLIIKGTEGAIANKTVTYDFERLMDGATLRKCSEFGDDLIASM